MLKARNTQIGVNVADPFVNCAHSVPNLLHVVTLVVGDSTHQATEGITGSTYCLQCGVVMFAAKLRDNDVRDKVVGDKVVSEL